VPRVIPKFEAFIREFPTIEALASAPLSHVLGLWNGLGYNRRAKFLHDSAKQIVARGSFPDQFDELVSLPGIGTNTAAAILNYGFETPTPYVETNIRTIFFHEFPADDQLVDDKQVHEFVEQTLDRAQPREWFYALMDYGAMLKANRGGRLSQSKHYKKQSPLKGSVREVRGQIVKILSQDGPMEDVALRECVVADERYQPALDGLIRDGLVTVRTDQHLSLTGVTEAS
jgi:A/G-specific adenine glycosylase